MYIIIKISNDFDQNNFKKLIVIFLTKKTRFNLSLMINLVFSENFKIKISLFYKKSYSRYKKSLLYLSFIII